MKKKFAGALLAGMTAAGCANAEVKPDYLCKTDNARYFATCAGKMGDYLNAVTAMRRGDYKTAVPYFESTIRKGGNEQHVRGQYLQATMFAEDFDAALSEASTQLEQDVKSPYAFIMLGADHAKQGDIAGALEKLDLMPVEDRSAMAEFVRFFREDLRADVLLDGETPPDFYLRVMNNAMYQNSTMPGYPPDDLEMLIIATGLYLLPQDPYVLGRAADYYKMMEEPVKAAEYLGRIPETAESYIFFQADAASHLDMAGRTNEAFEKWQHVKALLDRKVAAGTELPQEEKDLIDVVNVRVQEGLTKNGKKAIMEPSLNPQ